MDIISGFSILICSKNEDMAVRCVMLSCVHTASAMVRALLQRRILPNVKKKIFSACTSSHGKRHNSEGREKLHPIKIRVLDFKRNGLTLEGGNNNGLINTGILCDLTHSLTANPSPSLHTSTHLAIDPAVRIFLLVLLPEVG